MSGHTPKNKASNVNLHFLRGKVQESLDHGFDDDEKDIEELVRYFVNDVTKVEVEYMRSCHLYSVRFTTVERIGPFADPMTGIDHWKSFEYQYRFFVYSRR